MRHHDDAVTRYVERAAADPATLGVIVSGSVARGDARPDSDIDLYRIVDERVFAASLGSRRVMYVELDAGYEGGYYDVKLATPEYLDDVADRGDDPVRASLAIGRVVYDVGVDLDERMRRAAIVPEHQWAERVVSFVSQLRLHAGYFLRGAAASGDPLLARSAATHAVLAADRALLAAHHVLYAGPKYLRAAVAALPDLPAGWTDLADRTLAEATPEAAEAMVAAFDAARDWGVDDATALHSFVLDNELAWRTRVAPPEYR